MAQSRRRPRSSLIEALERDPGAFEFFQAVRVAERAVTLAHQRAGREPPNAVGRGVDPRQAAVHIAATPDLSFASAEVARARLDPGQPARLTQAVFGLTGTGGAMPHAFSELVQTSLRDRNLGLRDFLDLFNDRLAGLFYDAFAKYRPVIEAERRALTGVSTIDDLVRAVVGLGGPSLTGRLGVSDDVILHHAGLLGRQSRSVQAVEKVLSNAFAQPIRVEQFVGEWLPIATQDRTRIGETGLGRGAFSTLGVDAVVGRKAWSVQGRVRLLVGPLDYAAFESFLPGGSRQRRLTDLAAFALGSDVSFTQHLTLKPEGVPPLRLSPSPHAPGANRLGWNTWLGTKGPRRAPGIVDLAPASALLPPSKAAS